MCLYCGFRSKRERGQITRRKRLLGDENLDREQLGVTRLNQSQTSLLRRDVENQPAAKPQ